MGRQGALRVAGEGDLGPSPEPRALQHPLRRLLLGVPDSDLCPPVPVGGRRRLLPVPHYAVGGEGIQGPRAGLCVLTLVPQGHRGNLAKTERLGTAPENVTGFVDPSLLPRHQTSSG